MLERGHRRGECALGYHPYRFPYRRVTVLYGNPTASPNILWNNIDIITLVNMRIPDDKLRELIGEVCDSLFTLFNEDVGTGHKAIDGFFQSFTPTSESLLSQGKPLEAAYHWIRILDIVREWERQRNGTMHKGTPYFFLAASYIRGGIYDSAFRYLYDAIEEDKELDAIKGCPDSYRGAPAYMLASLVDKPSNYMYDYVVKPARKRIELFLEEYRNASGSSMRISEFDVRFMNEPKLEFQKFFFVYTLLQMIKLEREWNTEEEPNDFSKMRSRDILLDMCLVIDGVLRMKYPSATLISQGVYELFKSKGWVNSMDKNPGNLNGNLDPIISGDTADPPDVVVPTILDKTITYRKAAVTSEMSWFLLAWHLRNYAAHDLTPQKVLVERYPEISQALMNALFFSVE